MEIRDLKALVSIAEFGSLSAAAHKLNLTQPALSALLRRLESELNVKILVRHSRGVKFTEEGMFLLEKAYAILSDVTETQACLRELAQEPVGVVRLGLPTSMAAGLIPALFPSMRSQFPRVQLQIVEAMSGGLAELLHLGRLDLAVLFDIQPMPGLRSEPVLIEEICLMVRHDDVLAQRASVSIQDVAGHSLVMPSRAHSIRLFVERAAAAEGVVLTVDAEIDSFLGLVGLVRAGYATFLPAYLLMEDIREGRIVPVPISRPQMEWTLHLATRIDSLRPRAAMVVGRLLIDTCTALVRSREWPGKIHPRRPNG